MEGCKRILKVNYGFGMTVTSFAGKSDGHLLFKDKNEKYWLGEIHSVGL